MAETLSRPEEEPAFSGTGRTPWSRLSDLREEMLRLFGPLDHQPWSVQPSRAGAFATALVPWPALDIRETDEAYIVTAELPGLSADQISVRFKNGGLTISGQKQEDKREEAGSYHLRERSWGRFQRSLTLPDGIDAENMSAVHADGVLTVTIPKSQSPEDGEKTISVMAK